MYFAILSFGAWTLTGITEEKRALKDRWYLAGGQGAGQ